MTRLHAALTQLMDARARVEIKFSTSLGRYECSVEPNYDSFPYYYTGYGHGSTLDLAVENAAADYEKNKPLLDKRK